MPTTPIKNKSKKTQIRPTSITTTIDDDDIHDVREWGSAISTPTKSPLSKEKKLVPQSPKQLKMTYYLIYPSQVFYYYYYLLENDVFLLIPFLHPPSFLP